MACHVIITSLKTFKCDWRLDRLINVLLKHHAVDGIFAIALLWGYFIEHLAQNKLNCNAETTRGHHSSEVPILKYIHNIYIFCGLRNKNLFSYMEERVVFNRGELYVKNKQRETLWNISKLSEKEIPQRKKVGSNILYFNRGVKIKDLNSLKQIQQGPIVSRFNLRCSLQILNKELICQPEYNAVNQFGFNSALTDFEDLAMGDLNLALFFYLHLCFWKIVTAKFLCFQEFDQ